MGDKLSKEGQRAIARFLKSNKIDRRPPGSAYDPDSPNYHEATRTHPYRRYPKGQPPSLIRKHKARRARYVILAAKGLNPSEIAVELGVQLATVHAAVTRYGLKLIKRDPLPEKPKVKRSPKRKRKP